MITTEVLSVRRYKAGYELRRELWTMPGIGSGETTLVAACYTPSGDYIGDPKMTRFLIVKKGIKPEKRTPESCVCSVGFCKEEQKWYGWSHRAIFGFGIGDKLFDEYFDGATDETPFVAHGNKTITTLDEARQAACNFAESVS